MDHKRRNAFHFVEKIILFILLVIFVFSCHSKKKEGMVAQFDKEKLYVSDVHIPSHLSVQDSIAYLKIQADEWIKTQLLYYYAQEQLSDSTKKQIKKQLENIKKQLYVAAFQELLLKNTPSISISPEEIQKFYEEHKSSFILRHHLVQLNFVKLPQNDPGLLYVKKEFQASQPDLNEIKKWAKKAESAFLLPNTWTYFNELQKEIPFSFTDTSNFIKKTSYFEIKDGSSIIIGRIYKYLLPGDIAPLFIVENQIKSLLEQQKKQKYLLDHYNKLYQEALLTHDIKIYINEKK